MGSVILHNCRIYFCTRMVIQRKSINDKMNFQVDQAKLQQAFELAQQRTKTQEQIAEDRNDVNIYRINTQASLRK